MCSKRSVSAYQISVLLSCHVDATIPFNMACFPFHLLSEAWDVALLELLQALMAKIGHVLIEIGRNVLPICESPFLESILIIS